jgi:ribosomal protein S18 acetylase RimI-like enzyme
VGAGAGASAEAGAAPGPVAGADPARPLSYAFAEDEAAVRRCWPVFAQLRPRLGGEEEFVARWRAQVPEGYRILFAAEEGGGGAVLAAAGFRIMTTLVWGRSLYLDDLIADGAVRGRGLGSALLSRLREIAVAEGCANVQLDTGHQRHAAHLTYLRNGFRFSCHHLSLDLDGADEH